MKVLSVLVGVNSYKEVLSVKCVNVKSQIFQ